MAPPVSPVPAVMLVTVPELEAGIAHELFPHKKCELLGEPLADRSAVIVPLVVINPPLIFT